MHLPVHQKRLHLTLQHRALSRAMFEIRESRN